MPSLKAIRRRISSVRSTQQITRTFKLISAARLRRAQAALNASLPYSSALTRVADSVLMAEQTALGPREGAGKEALLAVVASDRGLAGGYNANIVKFAEEKARELRGAGMETRFIAVGRRALDHFRRTKAPVAGQYVGNQRLGDIELARKIAAQLLSAYQSGAAREVGIVYSHFRSAISQRPTYDRILPIQPPESAREGDISEGEDHGGRTADGHETGIPAGETYYLIEPSRAELIPVVLRAYVEASVFHALAEAEASEHAARMTAMDSATNNAADRINDLTLEMNRARQTMITKELMDIVGGAEALRG
jgi:F-type H+-transporting ATPase subunit gamma